MFFQLMIAIFLGLAYPSHSNSNDNGAVTTNDAGPGDTGGGTGGGTTGGGGTGGETGQNPPPKP